MIPDQIRPRWRHQRRKFLDQLGRRQQQRCGAVSPGRLQVKDEGFVVDDAQAPGSDGWSDDVATQSLEASPIDPLLAGKC